MKNALAIAAREIRSYFVSPVAYVVLTGFLLLSGWFFFNLLARFTYLLQIYSGMGRGGAERGAADSSHSCVMMEAVAPFTSPELKAS